MHLHLIRVEGGNRSLLEKQKKKVRGTLIRIGGKKAKVSGVGWKIQEGSRKMVFLLKSSSSRERGYCVLIIHEDINFEIWPNVEGGSQSFRFWSAWKNPEIYELGIGWYAFENINKITVISSARLEFEKQSFFFKAAIGLSKALPRSLNFFFLLFANW